MPNDPRVVEILLVEDNPGDVRLTREALDEAHVENELTIAPDGEVAIALLREWVAARQPRPVLVLLDLNLPGKDGRQVLADIKSDPELCMTPVIVLTSSAAEQDVLESYRHHANAYVTKPIEIDDFLRAVRSIEGFWLSVVRFPRP
ncbi:MAG: response regulator [Chloroflexi bacterium]|nr:response regulator [Chloroflexota bacterium]